MKVEALKNEIHNPLAPTYATLFMVGWLFKLYFFFVSRDRLLKSFYFLLVRREINTTLAHFL